MACCTQCKRQAAKVAGMAKSKKSMSKIVTGGLAVAGGYAAGKAVGALPFVQANPILQIAAPVVGAIVTPMLLGKGVTSAAVASGMVAAAATTAVTQYAPDLASKVGLSGVPYRSLNMPGVGNIPAGAVPKVRY